MLNRLLVAAAAVIWLLAASLQTAGRRLTIETRCVLLLFNTNQTSINCQIICSARRQLKQTDIPDVRRLLSASSSTTTSSWKLGTSLANSVLRLDMAVFMCSRAKSQELVSNSNFDYIFRIEWIITNQTCLGFVSFRKFKNKRTTKKLRAYMSGKRENERHSHTRAHIFLANYNGRHDSNRLLFCLCGYMNALLRFFPHRIFSPLPSSPQHNAT